MIERLSRQNHPAVSFSDARRGVISKALELLREIHNFLLRSSGPGQTQQALHVSSNRRLIDGLFDLVSLEGIYPCLLPGVGIPIERRVKSVLQGGIVTRPADDGRSREDDDSLLLSLILIELNKIALSDGQGLYPALRERTLVDLVAAQSQVAFAPTNMEVNQVRILEQKKLLDEYVSLFESATSCHDLVVHSHQYQIMSRMLKIIQDATLHSFSNLDISFTPCNPRLAPTTYICEPFSLATSHEWCSQYYPIHR